MQTNSKHKHILEGTVANEPGIEDISWKPACGNSIRLQLTDGTVWLAV
jgi:hypothetical protein